MNKKKNAFDPYTDKNGLDAYEKKFGVRPDFIVTDQDGLREGWLKKFLPQYWKRFNKIVYLSGSLADYIKRQNVSENRLFDMYNNYVEWANNIQPYLPNPLENDKVMGDIFVYHLNGKTIWAERWHTQGFKESVTFMFPEDR